VAIDPAARVVAVQDDTGEVKRLPYDRLVIGTGAVSTVPPIDGLGLPGVYRLRWMEDGFAVQRHLGEEGPQSAVIVGGGYIGVEMADSLSRRGLSVTVVERLDQVLTTVDPEFGLAVRSELEKHGVDVVTGVAVSAVDRVDGRLAVRGSAGFQSLADLVILVVGVLPSTELAAAAGVATGVRGAIRVTRGMETNVDDIYAAGDCVETYHRLLQRYVYLPLGTTAHKQGRVAGENAAGGAAGYAGSLGTQVVKVFDCVIARTGLRDREAAQWGFEPFTVGFETWDHKVYYPAAHPLRIRVTGDVKTGRLLGAQILGHTTSEVSKRVDILATALFHEMDVGDLSLLDLSYTPPLSSPWDPVQMAAQAWMRQAR
jgi:NADPH-dependent 2,4-dienoyl-CoA reductase/sulfur reductase-like enzyme